MSAFGLWPRATGLIVSVLVTSSVAPIAAAQAPPQRVLVLDLQTPSDLGELSTTLSDILLATVRQRLPNARVIGQSEIKVMLVAEQEKMMLGCSDDTSCLAEIGGAIGADHMITGSLGRVGSFFWLNIKLIDTGKADVVKHVSRKVSGSEDAVVDAVIELSNTVLGFEKSMPTLPPAASATAQPQAAGLEPPLAATAAPAQPWYKKWWVWTLGSVLVAGGASVAIGIAASQGSAEPSDLNGSVRVDITP